MLAFNVIMILNYVLYNIIEKKKLEHIINFSNNSEIIPNISRNWKIPKDSENSEDYNFATFLSFWNIWNSKDNWDSENSGKNFE